MVWLKFLLSLGIILFAGTKLARYGDAIAEKTGLGRIWIGLALLGLVTSIPELATAVSASALVKLPDLALGTLFGSCLFNLTIIAVLDAMHRKTPILSEVSSSHILPAGVGVLLIVIAAANIVAGENSAGFSLGWVGVPSIIIFLVYLVGARYIFRSERKQQQPEVLAYTDIPAGTVYLRFALAALAVIGAGIWLSFIGDEISITTGWGASFVGSLFLAITTSMPELTVTIAAVRLGAMDMALGDILGANMLDALAVIWADLAYTEGPILPVAAKVHSITAVIVIAMSLLVIAGIKFRTQRKTFGVISWYGPLLIMLYIFGAYALFTSGIAI